MHNIVQFPKANLERKDGLEMTVRRAILLLDILLYQTSGMIDLCLPGNKKDELERQLRELRVMLDTLRAVARVVFPEARHYK